MKAENVKYIETVVFMTCTVKSALMRKLQEADNLVTGLVNCPTVRFIEKGGITLMEELGKLNP